MALHTFVAGDVLLAQQLNDSFAAVSGLKLISATTIGSAVSSVTVSSAFSADYDAYKITISGGAASSASDLQLQLGSTTTGYYAGYSHVTYSTATASATANNNASNFSTVGVGTASGLDANIEIVNPFLTKHTFVSGSYAVSLTGSKSYLFAGWLNDTTSYTAFTILSTPGTLTGGTIRVYGLINS